MSFPLSPWPYAALATIEYVWIAPRIEMWVVFSHPMDQEVKPAHNLWSCWVDGAIKNVLWSAWNDAYTLRLSAGVVNAHPVRALLKYLGPDCCLQTTWGKDWEPWGYITCNYFRQISTITLTAGTHVNPDVGGVNVVFLDCSAGNILVRGFSGGVPGQELAVVRIDKAANNATMQYNFPFTTQKLWLHAGASETLNGEYGGWHFACDGSEWFDVSHAKHV